MFQSLYHLCGLSLDSLQYVHISLILESPVMDKVLQVGSHKSRVEGKDHLPQPAGNTFSSAAQDTICLLCCKGTLLAHIQLGLHYGPFPPSCFPAGWSPSMYWCTGLFLPICMTLCFPLLNFMRFPLAHFSSLSGLQHDPSAYQPLLPVWSHPVCDCIKSISSRSRWLLNRLHSPSPGTTAINHQIDTLRSDSKSWVPPADLTQHGQLVEGAAPQCRAACLPSYAAQAVSDWQAEIRVCVCMQRTCSVFAYSAPAKHRW